VPIVFSLLEKFDKNTTDIMISASLNFKLGTYGLNLSELAVEAGKQGYNLSEAMALTEVDGLDYSK